MTSLLLLRASIFLVAAWTYSHHSPTPPIEINETNQSLAYLPSYIQQYIYEHKTCTRDTIYIYEYIASTTS
ncbi:hypothetical protein F4820DRAFT_45943 [Hypoxylon rubiginosum]|uniref:Uncharacterized protein n=1 Tax=Hypoxylon rubiginosum TaxID=110542 RepID=A0ACB9ZDF9_9PEZI|nr:hypothetical protein F4820DRAFT_45943 [Hypoxylon rubiginosum]